MKNRVLAPSLALIILLTAASAALTQVSTPSPLTTTTTIQDWQALGDLKPGKKILVAFKCDLRDPVEGKFDSAIGSKLTLTQDGYTRSLEQRDIQSIYRLKDRWSRGRAARLGAIVGGVVGFTIGVEINIRTAPPNTSPAPQGFVIGAFAGGGLGWLAGGKRKSELLYEAK